MAEDWLADVRKYVSDADESIVAGIVRYCGIALRTRDASLVSFSDKKETDRVRENFLKKKLELTLDDPTLDSAIAAVGERMKADRTKNRVTVYYLLAEHFDKLALFSKPGRATKARAAPDAAPTAPLAAMGAAGAAAATTSSTPTPTPPAPAPAEAGSAVPMAAMAAAGAAATAAATSNAHAGTAPRPAVPVYAKAPPDNDGLVSFGLLAAAVVAGGFLLAMVVGGQLLPWADQFGTRVPDAPAAPAAPVEPVAAAQPAAGPAPVAARTGSGVVTSERDGKPMVTTYFDTGKSEVSPDFAAAAATVIAYLGENPGARAAISGFNDPTGNAAANAKLSKNRAQAVQAALVALGVDQARTDLVKPDDTTTTDLTPEQARRVELTIAE